MRASGAVATPASGGIVTNGANPTLMPGSVAGNNGYANGAGADRATSGAARSVMKASAVRMRLAPEYPAGPQQTAGLTDSVAICVVGQKPTTTSVASVTMSRLRPSLNGRAPFSVRSYRTSGRISSVLSAAGMPDGL